jgi:hypothetical protein
LSTLGTLIVGTGAQVDFGNAAQAGGGFFDVGTAILQPDSSTTMEVTGNFGRVFLQTGATLTYGPIDEIQRNDGGTITDLYNEGGTLAIGTDTLQLGGPGFVQTGGFEPHESFYGDGSTHVLDLGTIARGTALAPIQLGFTGSTALTELLNDPGLALAIPPNFVLGPYSGPPPLPSFSVDPNTNLLGAHTSIVGAYQAPNGPVTNMLVVKDVVV